MNELAIISERSKYLNFLVAGLARAFEDIITSLTTYNLA